MKKIWMGIGLLLMGLNGYSTNRYVSTTGSDANAGTIGSPFLTLGRAGIVAVSGDSIIIAAGTYTQTAQVIIAVGVHIKGAGTLTKIVLTYNHPGGGANIIDNAAVQLVSSTQNTNGNQTISDVWFDGNNYLTLMGVLVRRRGNVIIQRCRFTNFGVSALIFSGKTGEETGEPPATFSSGNQVINSTILNSGDRITQTVHSVSGGSIIYTGQRNLLFQYDTLRNTAKPQGHNGNLFSSVRGNNIGTKWLNNIFEKPLEEGASFNFIVESWYDQGGSVFAYNHCTGGGNMLDIGYGGANKGDSIYSWYIHDNIFTNSTWPTSNQNPPLTTAGSLVTGRAYQIRSLGTTNFMSVGAGSNVVGIIFTATGAGSGTGTASSQHPTESIAVQFESVTRAAAFTQTPPVFQNSNIGDAIIENNYCYRLGTFVQIGLSNYSLDFIDNLDINHNVMEQMGYANSTYAAAFSFAIGTNGGVRINNINIDNNTLTGGGSMQAGLLLNADVGTISNIDYRNNIITNVNSYGYITFRGLGAFTNINSLNNITYLNSFTNNPYYFSSTSTPSNFVNSGNLKLNPLFVSATDLHLGAGSPGLSNGLIPPTYGAPGYYIGAYPATTTNQNPVANAGADKNITLPTNFLTQVGSGTDADGTITGYLWSRISGPGTFNIVSPTAAATDITNLIAGTYIFQLRVTDNLGATGIDQATVTVNPSPPANLPPIAGAGGNKNITLPTNSVTQVGTGTDSDGTIASYSWAKTSGPATFTIVSPSSATTVINNLVAGVYTFTLTVTDNLGATGTASATVIVNSAANVGPSANAGANQAITWPTNSATLSGSGADADGTITGYSWAKVSGAGGTITSTSSASTTVTGLSVGVYVYRLTVIDNSGGTATDDIQVTVSKGSATISFSAPTLSQVYTGLPLSPTVVTVPAGLSTSIILDGTTGGKTNVGTYAAIGGITDPNWNFTPASATFTITKQTVTINAVSKTVNYDANPQSITATTSPTVTGLTYSYEGSPTPPTAVGVYDVDITLVNANYQATPVSVVLTIQSNAAAIFISDTLQTYDGFTSPVIVTTNPGGLPVSVTYNLSGTAPIDAGTYNVIATITSGGTGADTATLVIAKRTAVLSWAPIAAIPEGTLLTGTQLNAVSDIAGTWSYSSPLGTVLPIGVTGITATFTPTDTNNNNGGTVNNSVSVFGLTPFLNYFIYGGGFYFIEQ